MLSLTSASVRESACDFSATRSARDIYRDIVALKQDLTQAFHALACKQPVPTVGHLIRALRRRR